MEFQNIFNTPFAVTYTVELDPRSNGKYFIHNHRCNNTLQPLQPLGVAPHEGAAVNLASSWVSREKLMTCPQCMAFSFGRETVVTINNSPDFSPAVRLNGTMPDGTVWYYVGAIEDGVRHGYGRTIWGNGDVFMGMYDKGNHYGGILVSNKEVYMGMFTNGRLDTTGPYTHVRADGDVITQDDHYSAKNAVQTFKNPDGSRDGYKGQMLSDGIPYGWGMMLYSDNVKYYGMFRDGVPSGPGAMIFPNTDYFIGYFSDGIANGKGTYIFEKKLEVYVGDIKDGILHGNGLYAWSNGKTHNGVWKDGNRC
jgi:hypothetical protein